MIQPLVSVLMTAYNREKYIVQAIESVLLSSFTDFELIIVDDGSVDKTVTIAKQYAGRDNRVRVFVNEKNLGDYSNRNKAASHALGKYIKYVDSDDYIYPWGLELMVKMMEDTPGSGWGLCSMEPNKKIPFPLQLSPKEIYEYHYFGPGLFTRSPLSAIIKRNVFEEAGGFSDTRMAGDFEMWHRLAQKFPVTLMPQGMIWYRQHDNQEMNDYRGFLGVYEEIKIKYICDPACPLNLEDRVKLLKTGKRKSILSGVKNLARLRMNDLALDISRIRKYSKTSITV